MRRGIFRPQRNRPPQVAPGRSVLTELQVRLAQQLLSLGRGVERDIGELGEPQKQGKRRTRLIDVKKAARFAEEVVQQIERPAHVAVLVQMSAVQSVLDGLP